jgi:hypothetical protein
VVAFHPLDGIATPSTYKPMITEQPGPAGQVWSVLLAMPLP